jgi:hypothetical protein
MGPQIKGVFIGLLIIIAIFVGFLEFAITRCSIKRNYIESNKLIKLEIHLHTDGKTIDTIYIYRK